MNGVMGVKKACFDWSEVSMKLESYCAPIIFSSYAIFCLGAVQKLRLQEGRGRWTKKSTFCKRLCHRKCKQSGVGVQKNQIL